MITQQNDPERLAQTVCHHMVESRGYYRAWIALFDTAAENHMVACDLRVAVMTHAHATRERDRKRRNKNEEEEEEEADADADVAARTDTLAAVKSTRPTSQAANRISDLADCIDRLRA